MPAGGGRPPRSRPPPKARRDREHRDRLQFRERQRDSRVRLSLLHHTPRRIKKDRLESGPDTHVHPPRPATIPGPCTLAAHPPHPNRTGSHPELFQHSDHTAPRDAIPPAERVRCAAGHDLTALHQSTRCGLHDFTRTSAAKRAHRDIFSNIAPALSAAPTRSRTAWSIGAARLAESARQLLCGHRQTCRGGRYAAGRAAPRRRRPGGDQRSTARPGRPLGSENHSLATRRCVPCRCWSRHGQLAE